MTRLVKSVIEADPTGTLLSTIFSWELTNEVHLSTSAKPFSLTAGKVTTADGKMYDMADPNQRQQCIDNIVINWANQWLQQSNQLTLKQWFRPAFSTYQIIDKKGLNGLLPIDAEYPRFSF